MTQGHLLRPKPHDTTFINDIGVYLPPPFDEAPSPSPGWRGFWMILPAVIVAAVIAAVLF